MSAPSLLLLIWFGLAAACAAAVPATMVGGVPRGTWSLAPRPHSRRQGAAWSLIAGGIAYPAIYGIIFEVMGRSDVGLGLVAGGLHALAAFGAARPRSEPRAAARAAAAHLTYGVIIAFLYVTP